MARTPRRPSAVAAQSPRARRRVHPAKGERVAREAPLSILMIASEAVPFSKTGGLGDVAGALPAALARLGHRVTLVTPMYRGGAAPAGAAGPVVQATIPLGGRALDAWFHQHEDATSRARTVLVECPELFDRDGLYGIGNADFPDNPRRFAFFARAALAFADRAGERPSVVHAHDWQAGLAPLYLRTRYRDHPVLGALPSLFTIHNIAYQGLFAPTWMPALDLGAELFTQDAIEYWGQVSFLKAGINFSTLITTVSRKYAEELLTPEYGFGFDGILRRRAAVLSGIRNGIDVDRWDPRKDPYLPAPYSERTLAGKLESKRAVLAILGLAADEAALRRPLIGMISRMVDQKGLDLIAANAAELPRLDASYAILGTGAPEYERMWTELARLHPARIGARIGFDERLAHLIEAGADVFLMPSRFEPCGLNQMYSLRYGTVPIVRATGGLDDTVRDADSAASDAAVAQPFRAANGFKFDDPTPQALMATIRRALEAYRNRTRWRALQVAGMREDFSWDASAREYVKLYRRAIAR